MIKDKKARKIEIAINLIISSLVSHLPFTYDNNLKKPESKLFHKKCVKEYSEILKILSELY